MEITDGRTALTERQWTYKQAYDENQAFIALDGRPA